MLFGVVESVADDEPVLDRKADVVDRHVHEAPRGLAEKTRRPKTPRAPRSEDVLQVGQRQPCIDDVLDDHDIAPFDPTVEILEQLYLSG